MRDARREDPHALDTGHLPNTSSMAIGSLLLNNSTPSQVAARAEVRGNSRWLSTVWRTWIARCWPYGILNN